MPSVSSDVTWRDDAVLRLRVLWEEGRSTAEIGRQLGISKNAVIGKAHRLKLSQRPSPIRVAPPGEPRPSRRSRPSPQTLPDGSPPGCAAQKPSRASLPPLASSSDPFASTLPLPVLARPPRLNFGKICLLLAPGRTREARFPLLRRPSRWRQTLLWRALQPCLSELSRAGKSGCLTVAGLRCFRHITPPVQTAAAAQVP